MPHFALETKGREAVPKASAVMLFHVRCRAVGGASVALAAMVVACTSTSGLTSPDVDDAGAPDGGAGPDSGGGTVDSAAPDGAFASEGGGASDRYRTAVMSDSPVGYWKLDETSGIQALDQLGANHGTYQGGYTLGEPSTAPAGGGAVRFGGTNGRVAIGSVLDFAGKTAITLEAWVNLSVLDSDYKRVIAKRANNATGYSIYCQMLGGGCTFELGDGSLHSCSIGLVTGQWFHVVGTYDGATMRGYVNGNEVCSKAETIAFVAASAPLSIGSFSNGGNWLNGAVDEVAIYETALSGPRVKAHYRAMIDP